MDELLVLFGDRDPGLEGLGVSVLYALDRFLSGVLMLFYIVAVVAVAIVTVAAVSETLTVKFEALRVFAVALDDARFVLAGGRQMRRYLLEFAWHNRSLALEFFVQLFRHLLS